MLVIDHGTERTQDVYGSGVPVVSALLKAGWEATM